MRNLNQPERTIPMTPRYESKAKQRRQRSQRRARPETELPVGLDTVNLGAAGIDVGANEHWVAVPRDRATQPVQRFHAFTADLHQLADWLEQCRIVTVAMESTGVFWIPLMEILEARGFEVHLVDPRRLKNVPGRKSDVLDCQWIQQLHTFGLLRGAFRPVDQVCVLRAFLRQRAMLISSAATHIQHMQKALTQMNIKLQHVLSDLTGKTGMRIIRAILEGERDPHKLAQLRDGRCRKSAATIAKALEGNWRAEHLFSLRQAVELFEFYSQKIAECDREVEAHLGGFEDRSGDQGLAEKPKSKKQRHTALHFDAREHLFRLCGVDLTEAPGLDSQTVLTVVSEIGTDISKWPTGNHFSSWLGVCPGSKISGGKTLSSKSKPCANRAATALRLAANGLYRSQTSVGAFLRRKKAQLGAPKAITATAHKLALIIYAMLRDRKPYVELGADHYAQQFRKRSLLNLQRNAKQFGFELVGIAEAPAPP
jgi:transposase